MEVQQQKSNQSWHWVISHFFLFYNINQTWQSTNGCRPKVRVLPPRFFLFRKIWTPEKFRIEFFFVWCEKRRGHKKFWRLNAFIFIDYFDVTTTLCVFVPAAHLVPEIRKLTNEIEKLLRAALYKIELSSFYKRYVLPDYMFL